MSIHSRPGDIPEFIRTHPELKTIRLTWLWHFKRGIIRGSYEHHDREALIVIEGRFRDSEYCWNGSREGAVEYLSRYDCWDGVPLEDRYVRIVELSDSTLDVEFVPPWDDGEDDEFHPFDVPDLKDVHDMTTHVEDAPYDLEEDYDDRRMPSDDFDG